MNATSWYRSLEKPGWAPKQEVFGRVWSVLYPIIIAANLWVIVLLILGDISWYVALPFWLNLFFNLIYSPIQFGLKNNWLASLDILLVFATIVWAIVAIWPYQLLIGLAFAPYLIWVTIATVLQLTVTYKNER